MIIKFMWLFYHSNINTPFICIMKPCEIDVAMTGSWIPEDVD